MEAHAFRALVQQHLLPLFSGAQLVPGHSRSPTVRPAVVERGRYSIEIKPSQATPWSLTITRPQPFAKPQPGRVSEKALAKAFVAALAAMPEGFEGGTYAADLMARLPRRLVVDTLCPEGVERGVVLAAIDQLEAWSCRSYEGQPIVAAVGFTPEGAGQEGLPAVQLREAWAEDFGAVLTNSFDTMLVADGHGRLLAYDAMAAPAEPPPLAPVRLAAVAHWSAQHPDRLALVLNRADHLLAQRSAKALLLQRAINGQPFQALDRRLRQEILAIDGATILDHNGQILAAGAILKVPGGSSGGGRRAAAVALAALGVGIKVSADGGIEGFRRTTIASEGEQEGKQAASRMSFRLMK
jgi:hypothetical protein